MENGIRVVDNKQYYYFFDPQSIYSLLMKRVCGYNVRPYKIYGEHGYFSFHGGLNIRKCEGSKIVVKMVETKFLFRRKMSIISFHVAIFGKKIYFTSEYNIFGDKIYFTNEYNILDFCWKRKNIPNNLIIIFSHGLICHVSIRAWDEKYEEEFMGKKKMVDGKYIFENDAIKCCLRDEPAPIISEHIKMNLLEMVKAAVEKNEKHIYN